MNSRACLGGDGVRRDQSDVWYYATDCLQAVLFAVEMLRSIGDTDGDAAAAAARAEAIRFAALIERAADNAIGALEAADAATSPVPAALVPAALVPAVDEVPAVEAKPLFTRAATRGRRQGGKARGASRWVQVQRVAVVAVTGVAADAG